LDSVAFAHWAWRSDLDRLRHASAKLRRLAELLSAALGGEVLCEAISLRIDFHLGERRGRSGQVEVPGGPTSGRGDVFHEV
jgi:hypothetical protein